MTDVAAPDPDQARSTGADPTPSLSRGAAAAVASLAFLLPLAMSRSTTPTPDHPRVFLWYRGLRKPGFKPPDVAIPVAWTLLESGFAASAYRLLRRPATPARNRSLAWLGLNVVSIGAWSSLFFGARNLPASTIAAAALVGTGAAYVAEVAEEDRAAAAAGVAFTAWVGFATVLTAALWRLNRGR